MKNLNVLEKSRGVLTFAFNTDAVNYVAIAEQSARLIKHNLALPTTLVTDKPINSEYFDRVIYVENNLTNLRSGFAGGTSWRNCDRWRAYQLSPYNETILLDCDYLTLDCTLLNILDVTQDYLMFHNNKSPAEQQDVPMGVYSLPTHWATVIVFKRTPKSEMLFNLVARIQDNYEYYIKLYNLNRANYRNDYAFTIADNILSGYTAGLSIPWGMLTLDKPLAKLEIQNQKLLIREHKSAHLIARQDLHIMDKDYLSGELHKQFVDSICQS